MSYQLPNMNAYANIINIKHQSVSNAQIKQQLESTALKQNLQAQRTQNMTSTEQEQFLTTCIGNTMFNEDHQVLVNNLRVLEVIQRQIFVNPTLQNQLQSHRTAYYNAIQQQIKSLDLTVDNLKQLLGQLDLQKQLKYAIEYIISSSDRSTSNSNKLSKLQLYFNSFLNAITSDSTENCHLKQALKELLEIIEEIQGQEGCMPLNWEGTKQLRQLYSEINDRCQTNPTLVESYQHWQDRLSNIYYNQLIERRWV